ncbi:MAG: PEGA domain-containing protein, partial [Bryobacteraceae bacterium]
DKPFAAEYLPTLLYKIVREDPLPPRRLNATLGEEIDPVLKRALAKNSQDRYPTCVEFVDALAAACNASPEWTPLPRGASQNMPTGGSQTGLTVDETAITAAAPSPTIAGAAPTPQLSTPAPPPVSRPAPVESIRIEPIARRLPPPEPSHAFRNVFAGAAAIALLVIGGFVAIKKISVSAPLPRTAAVQQPGTPAPAPTPSPVPAATPPVEKPAAPATPPVETAKVVTPKPEEKPVVERASKVAEVPAVASTSAAAPFELTTAPAGAEAVFDDGRRCFTPCSLSFPAGRHTFAVSHDGFRDAHRIFEVPRDTGLIVDLAKASGTLSLISNPPGLAISIDGQEQTQKTPASFNLAAGQHRIQVYSGARREQFQVEIRDGAIASRTIDLQ